MWIWEQLKLNFFTSSESLSSPEPALETAPQLF